MKTQIIINSNGTIRFIHNDDIAEVFIKLGEAKTTRASYVEPLSSGKWEADLTPVWGPILGPFNRRDEAVSAEIEWLQNHNIPIPTN